MSSSSVLRRVVLVFTGIGGEDRAGWSSFMVWVCGKRSSRWLADGEPMAACKSGG
jgi:hypothetical protein